MAVERFHRKYDTFPDWKKDTKKNALVSKQKHGKHTVTLLLPEAFMNNSGKVLSKYIASVKAAERMIVVYDDLDLPIGTVKVVFDRGSGGHRGVESIIKHLRTKKFIRVRVGIAPVTPTGKLRKPSGEERVVKFLMASFLPAEKRVLTKAFRTVSDALTIVLTEGRDRAMNVIN